jgi:hypothetical protein
MTPAQVYSQIRSQANEDTAAFWEDSEILRHMSDAENIIAQQVGCTEDKTSFSSADGTREYTLGSTVGTITRLTWDRYPLKAITVDQLDVVEGVARGGVDSTGSPEYYYLWGQSVGFSPVPGSAKTVDMYHYAVPAAIDSTAVTSWTMPDKYGQYVTPYCLWQMFSKDQQTQEEGQAYYRTWLDGLGTIQRDWIQTKNRGRYPTVNIVSDIFVE